MIVYKCLVMILVQAGHTCGDDMDLVDGQPIGSIRASFGFCSTFSDAETFLRFIRQCFLHAQPEKCLVDIGNEPMKTNELEVVTSVGLSNGLLSSNHGHVLIISCFHLVSNGIIYHEL